MTQSESESKPVPTEINVRFAETDAMGVVHHGTYILWFEVGRVAWMDAVGMPYTEVAQSGHHFAVTGIHAKYRASCVFGDTVRIDTWCSKLRSRQVSFCYELRNVIDQTLLVTGSSEHICVDENGNMAQMPSEVLARLQRGFCS